MAPIFTGSKFGFGRVEDATPVYAISASTSSVNEGSSVTFTVTTTNVDSGTTLYWSTNTVSGTVNTSDFSDSATSGSFTITSGSGTVTRTLANDATTEGSESFQLQIRTGSTSGTIVATSSTVTIGDTSLNPTYSVSPSTSSVNEGSSVTFTVTTTDVPNGTTLYWSTNTVSGTVNASDFSDSATSGSFTITSGSGTVTRTLANDVTTEGSESFQLQIRTGSTSGTIVATSSTVTISDTSTGARYWRYVEGSAVAAHHPRISRLILRNSSNVDTNIVTYTSDNCSDLGVYEIGTVSYDFGSNVVITKVKIYSTFGSGLRSSNYTVQYSNNNSTWTHAFGGVISNYSSCGIHEGTITS